MNRQEKMVWEDWLYIQKSHVQIYTCLQFHLFFITVIYHCCSERCSLKVSLTYSASVSQGVGVGYNNNMQWRTRQLVVWIVYYIN